MSDFFSKISAVFPKIIRDNWIVAVLVLIGFLYFYNYLKIKGSSGAYGSDMMSGNNQPAYKKQNGSGSSNGPRPAEDIDASGNGSFSNVSGASQNMAVPSACNKPNMQNPADLLPKDNNSQWAQLNPAGKGDLANINLLKAGYHIGIDTVGQTLRNANLQIRSEPANPQISVGPWNLSTIEPDFMRPPMELGQGSQ
jgi:hypothetical protein